MWDSHLISLGFSLKPKQADLRQPPTPMLKLWSSSIAVCVCGENNFICVYVTAASDVYVYFFRPADSEGSLQVENVRLFVFNSRVGECLLEYSEDWIRSVRLPHIYSSFHKVWLHGAVRSWWCVFCRVSTLRRAHSWAEKVIIGLHLRGLLIFTFCLHSCFGEEVREGDHELQGKKIFQHSACFLLSLGRCC